MILRIVVAGVLVIGMVTLRASQAPARNVEQLSWIAGCWTRALSDGVNEEQWMKPAGGSMLGMSRTVRGGHTTEFEFLRIASVDGALAYIAKPSGQAEATFLVKTLAQGEVVFENLSHDFPQRVIYRQSGEGRITARVEGTLNGKARGTDFAFARCQ